MAKPITFSSMAEVNTVLRSTVGQTVQLINKAHDNDEESTQILVVGTLEQDPDDLMEYTVRMKETCLGPCVIHFFAQHVDELERLERGGLRIILQ